MPQLTNIGNLAKTPLIDAEIVREACIKQKAPWTPTTNPEILAKLKAVTLEHIKARLGAVGNLQKLEQLHAQAPPDVNAIITDFSKRRAPAGRLAGASAGVAGAGAGAGAAGAGAPAGPSRPARVDWRNYNGRNCVSAVEDQGGCGSCVAFGTTAMMESMLLVEHNLKSDLSEADIFFCGGGSCKNGWYPGDAVSYVHDKGIPPASCFPYPAAAMGGNDVPCSHCVARNAIAAKASQNTGIYNVEQRKQYLAHVGPMIGCFEVYEDFETYFWGRSDPAQVYVHVSGKDIGSHCVEIIGYDDGQRCWICKNSWGTGAPEGGFFQIGYGQCGIDSDSPFLLWNFGSPFWGVWGTSYATRYINKVILGDTSPKSPALASLNGRLYLAWKGDGNDNLNVMYSSDNGRTFGHKYTSPETSPQAPALCAHNGNLYIGWKGDGNDHLNVALVNISGNNITGFSNKVVLGDTSPLSPTLASLNNRLYLGWKGDGNDNLNVMYSADNGHTFGNKYVSPETSPQAPALCAFNGHLYVSWKGDGNDHLNVALVNISGNSITGFVNKAVLGDTSPLSPSLTSLNNQLCLGWRGDGNDFLNVMYSNDGHNFGSKFVSPETSSQAPVICAHNGEVYVGWKGDGNDNLNVGPVIPCIYS